MDLSRMMRHVLYDASESETTLDKEVEFIQNYIELMRIRYVDDVMINFSAHDINTCRKVRIPPLLLIVLIENAFKHGISYNHRSFINIEVMEQGDNLVCIVENSRHYAQAATKHSGIGLSNIKKRLQLLYADNFSLTTDNTETDVYRIKLVIPKIR
jgi:LytS/YehU family sensor histidine kinase